MTFFIFKIVSQLKYNI